MSSEAQVKANRENAKHSTGPKTEEGKQAVSLNNFRHGLAGTFHLLPWENETAFEVLQLELHHEHKPSTPTEEILVQRMVQHEWLRQRAVRLQDPCFNDQGFVETPKYFSLYLRYQTTHERAFHKCLSDLLKLRAEKRKTEIGFESQKVKEAEQARKQELHEARTRLANAEAAHLELDTHIRGTIEAVLPGHTPIPFNEVKSVLKVALEEVFGPKIKANAA